MAWSLKLKERVDHQAAWHSYRMLIEGLHHAIGEAFAVAPGFLPESYAKLV